MKSDTHAPCRRCKYRHGWRSLLDLPKDLPCTECIPLPPEGFQPGRVGYQTENGQHRRARRALRKTVRRPCRTKGCAGTVTQLSRSGLCVACSVRATNNHKCPICGKDKAQHVVVCADCRKPKEEKQ